MFELWPACLFLVNHAPCGHFAHLMMMVMTKTMAVPKTMDSFLD